MLFINAPWYFRLIWATVSPFLSEKTVACTEVLGSDYKSRLLELVDAENLPVEYGGRCVCSGSDGTGCVHPLRAFPPAQHELNKISAWPRNPKFHTFSYQLLMPSLSNPITEREIPTGPGIRTQM